MSAGMSAAMSAGMGSATPAPPPPSPAPLNASSAGSSPGSSLPVPVAAGALALPARTGGALRRMPTFHARAPVMEIVTCLDHAPGLLAAAGGRVCGVWSTTSHEQRHRFVHEQPVQALWLERQSRWLAVASGDTVVVVDADSGRERLRVRHAARVHSVHIGNAAPVLASADVGGGVQLHDVVSGRPLRRLQVAPGRTRVFVLRQHYVWVFEDELTHLLVDIRTGHVVRRLPLRPDVPMPMQGQLVNTTLVSHTGSTLRVFDCARLGGPLFALDYGSPIRSIDIHDAADLVLVATEAGGLHLVDIESGAPRGRHDSFTSPLRFARFGPATSLMVAAGEALVMHLVDGRHARSYRDETRPFVAMAVHREQDALLLTDRDGGVARVGLHDGRLDRPYAGAAGSVSAVVSGAGVVAVGAYDGWLRAWRDDGEPVLAVDLGDGPVQAVALQPGARRLWAGTWAGRVFAFDLDSGAQRLVVALDASSIRTLALDASGRRLFAGGDQGERRLLALAGDGARLLRGGCQDGCLYHARFDADGTLLVTDADGTHQLRGDALAEAHRYPGRTIRWFDVDAEGHRLVALSLRGELAVHDRRTRRIAAQRRLADDVMHRSVAWLGPDRIVTASSDGRLRVWDAQLQPVATLESLGDGFLWRTPAHDEHPGWLHTDRPERVDVFEHPVADHEGAGPAGAAALPLHDPRRLRHLAVWASATHVMQAVRGAPPEAAGVARPVPAGALAWAGATHRIGLRR